MYIQDGKLKIYFLYTITSCSSVAGKMQFQVTQQVPTLLWFYANGRNMLGPTMLRVVGQQSCVRFVCA